MKIPSRTWIAMAAAAAIASGCALTPPAAKTSLDQAREAYRAAQADPHVAQLAPMELTQAGGALNRAEQLAAQGAEGEAIQHAAYMAMQEAQIARHRAMARAAEQELQQADAARNRVILEARARQAEAAREQAEKERAAALERASEAERAREQTAQQREQAMQAREQARKKLGSDIARLRGELAQLRARETERGWVLGLGGEMLFDAGKSTLKPGAARAIERVARFMNEHPERDIAIEGFTDSTGSDATNQRLSEERAHAVRQALVANGVPANRIQARGHGEAFPIATNDTAAGRQLNRRVEIVIAPEAGGQAAAGR